MTEESQSVTVETDTPIDTIESESVIHDTQPQDGSETKTEETSVATSEDKTEEEEQPQKPINPRTAQRKAEKERLIRENAYKDAQLEQMKAELAKYTQTEKPTVKERDYSQEPNIQDYDDVLEYTKDMAKYVAKQTYTQEVSALSKQKQVQAFEEGAETLRAEKPDFDEKIEALKNTGLVEPQVEEAIFSSSMSAEVAYHLAQYPVDLVTLRGLPKEGLPKAIKAIEAFIKNAASNPAPRQTQATPPIKPVGSKASITPDLSRLTQEELENMPQAEFEAKYMKNRR